MEEGFLELISTPQVIWFIIGLTLVLAEFIIPGLVILFFGLGCWITSLFVLLIPGGSFTIQLLVFLLSSVGLLILLRNKARSWMENKSTNKENDELLEEFIGKKGTTETVFKKGIGGKVQFKGTIWEAESDYDIAEGELVKIIGKESIKLIVKPLNIS